jgi:hypothetical protein
MHLQSSLLELSFQRNLKKKTGLFLCKIVLNFICGNSAKTSSLDGGIIRTNRIF